MLSTWNGAACGRVGSAARQQVGVAVMLPPVAARISAAATLPPAIEDCRRTDQRIADVAASGLECIAPPRMSMLSPLIAVGPAAVSASTPIAPPLLVEGGRPARGDGAEIDASTAVGAGAAWR